MKDYKMTALYYHIKLKYLCTHGRLNGVRRNDDAIESERRLTKNRGLKRMQELF